jgi:RHS repeat-associated protein
MLTIRPGNELLGSIRPPLLYFDHCAIRAVASRLALRDHFLETFRSRGTAFTAACGNTQLQDDLRRQWQPQDGDAGHQRHRLLLGLGQPTPPVDPARQRRPLLQLRLQRPTRTTADSARHQPVLLDGPSFLEELDGNGVTKTSYLANPQVIDEVLTFTSAGAGYWPLTDALGSIVAVTDAMGTVVRNNSYDVYGERTSSTGTGPALAFGFTGREHDSSGLNYHRDRYLDVRLGRWNQPDRLGFVDGINLFQYVRGQPNQFVDRAGKFAHILIAAALGAAFVPLSEQVRRRNGAREPDASCISAKRTSWHPLGAALPRATQHRARDTCPRDTAQACCLP